MKVVLCEDDVDVRDYFRTYLENEGIEVVALDCGNEALKMLANHYFDAVFTDFAMKNGDGRMLSKFCDDRGLPCVVFTGMEPSEIRPYIPYKIPIYGKLDFLDLAKGGLLSVIAKSPQLDKAFYKMHRS